MSISVYNLKDYVSLDVTELRKISNICAKYFKPSLSYNFDNDLEKYLNSITIKEKYIGQIISAGRIGIEKDMMDYLKVPEALKNNIMNYIKKLKR